DAEQPGERHAVEQERRDVHGRMLPASRAWCDKWGQTWIVRTRSAGSPGGTVRAIAAGRKIHGYLPGRRHDTVERVTGHSDDLHLAHVMADAADDITMRRFQAVDLKIDTKPDLTPVS